MFFVLCALGVMSFFKLPITRFPNIDLPLVAITVTDPGVAPSELETQISKRVEDAVAKAHELMQGKLRGRIVVTI